MILTSDMYVPALRWRQGEYQALYRLSAEAKLRTVPFIMIPEVEFDFEIWAPKKSVHEHVHPLIARFKSKWNQRPAWISVHKNIVETPMDNGQDVFSYVFDGLRSFEANAIPAIPLDASPSVLNSVTAIANRDSLGAAVIVKQANDTVVHTQDEECEERKAGPFSLSKFGVRSVLAKDCTCRNVNGELTQGENIADLGGLRLAYRAWGEYVKTNGAEGGHLAPDNFPKDSAKRFFFSWATIWRQNITAKLAAKYIAVDPHAPPEVRVNGTVSNMPEFIASFDVKEGDGLFRTDETRVDIW